MIHAQLSELVEQDDIAALHRGELPATSPLSELFGRAGVGRCVPADALSAWEVDRLSPALTRMFELSFDNTRDESAAEEVLARSPLIASVDRHWVRVGNLAQALLGESEQEPRPSRGALEAIALGCGVFALGIAELTVLIGIAAALVQL